MITVTALSLTAVKGTRLRTADSVELTKLGARGDRRFYVIDERGRMVNAKMVGDLQSVVADVSNGSLALAFPDGRVITDEIAHDEEVTTRFYSQPRKAHALAGPFSEALSEHLGMAVRIVEPEKAGIDRGRGGATSLVSRASLARLAEVAEEPEIDARRFRMLFEVDGLEAHAEDRWVGQKVRIGEAAVRFRGHVGRCVITSRDPQTGEVTLPTLDLLREYRSQLDCTEPLPFGIYGEVLAEGTVRLGDEVAPVA